MRVTRNSNWTLRINLWPSKNIIYKNYISNKLSFTIKKFVEFDKNKNQKLLKTKSIQYLSIVINLGQTIPLTSENLKLFSIIQP